jgi:predicted transcriptional regulator
MEGPSGDSTRVRVRDDVRRHPGSSAREIQRRLDLGWGDAAYHLDRLTRSGEVRRERGGWRDYYFANDLTWADRRIFQALHSPAERTLVLATTERPGATFTDLVGSTGLGRATVSFHLRKLVELGVLLQRPAESGGGFTVVDPERIRALLTTYAASLKDRWVDRFVEAFGGLVSE